MLKVFHHRGNKEILQANQLLPILCLFSAPEPDFSNLIHFTHLKVVGRWVVQSLACRKLLNRLNLNLEISIVGLVFKSFYTMDKSRIRKFIPCHAMVNNHCISLGRRCVAEGSV